MKKIPANLIISFAIGAVVGLLLGWFLPRPLKISQPILPNLVNNFSAKPTATTDNVRGKVDSVASNSLTLSARVASAQGPVAVTKVAQINNDTAVYLLTPKTSAEAGDDYNKKVEELKNQLTKAAQAKDSKKISAIVTQLRELTLANNTQRNEQASELKAKFEALPLGSAERQVAEMAYLELTSAFKYSKITLADIKSGDTVQVWSQDNLTNHKFVATKIEIRR